MIGLLAVLLGIAGATGFVLGFVVATFLNDGDEDQR